MRKGYLSIFLCFVARFLSAQLTESNHSFVNGEQFITFQCDSLGINPGGSGAAVVWNFSSIATRSSIVNSYSAATNSNTLYPIPGISVASSTSNVSYYQSSVNNLHYWGGNILINPVIAELIYTSPAIVAVYPMNLGSTGTSAIAGTLNTTAPLPNSGTFTGLSKTTADGTGVINLPNGTFTNVIRIVTTQTINFTVPLVSGTVTQMNYDYYQIGKKESLFTISTSTVNLGAPFSSTSSQTFVTRSVPYYVGINENKQTIINLAIYPNPSSTSVIFNTIDKSEKQILIYELAGKLVEKEDLSNGNLVLDVLSYHSGLYLYKVINSTNQTLTAGKFSVNH